MKITRNLAVLTVLAACLNALLTPAFAAKPPDKPPISEDVEKELNRLQELIGRMHGYQVFRAEAGISGSFSGTAIVEARARLYFCPEDVVIAIGYCDDSQPDNLVLETAVFAPSLDAIQFTFDEESNPEFADIVEQLTNGNGNDYFVLRTEAFIDGQLGASIANPGSEFYWAQTVTPIAPIVGTTDFHGLEIGSISIRVGSFFANYNSNQNQTEFDLYYEAFFEMPQ